MSLTVEELATAYHGAWVELDPDAIIALHSAQTVFHLHGATEAATGRDAVRELVFALFRLVPDLKFEPKRLYLGVDHIVFDRRDLGLRPHAAACRHHQAHRADRRGATNWCCRLAALWNEFNILPLGRSDSVDAGAIPVLREPPSTSSSAAGRQPQWSVTESAGSPGWFPLRTPRGPGSQEAQCPS